MGNIFPDYKIAGIDSLIPYARNSRTHSDEQVAQIAASIKEFGFTNPILIDKDGGIIAGHLWASDRKQTTLLKFDKPSRNGVHPTMKPVELFEYQMLNNTKGSDVVLDLFGGSGTTMLACEKHGRKAYLMELDPRYCDVIIKRWQDFTGKEALHADTGDKFNDMFINGRSGEYGMVDIK